LGKALHQATRQTGVAAAQLDDGLGLQRLALLGQHVRQRIELVAC
jgi:hypothetical protein